MTVPKANMVDAITRHLGSDLTEAQVSSVLEAWNAVKEGDPVGTVRRDEDTGAIAHRVDADGVHLWRVSTPDGAQHNDMQATLSWPVLHQPEA